MTSERFLLDTMFVQAFLNKRDPYHQLALTFLPRVREAKEVWITEAILIEVGNSLATIDRVIAAQFIAECYKTANMHVVSVDTLLMNRALGLYKSRADKTWGMTDCILFLVMEEHGITDAVTTDRHFIQAGYRALLSA